MTSLGRFILRNRMLDGAVFGVDIVEVNPPLMWWFAMIPNAIAHVMGISEIDAFRGCISFMALGSIVVVDYILSLERWSWRWRTVFAGICGCLFIYFIHGSFGQREHVATFLVFPYLAAAAARIGGIRIPLALSAGIGVAAGLGFSIKPYFVLIPALIELVLVAERRSLRTLVRPESLAALAVAVAYAIAVFAFAPGWISVSFRMHSKLTGHFPARSF